MGNSGAWAELADQTCENAAYEPKTREERRDSTLLTVAEPLRRPASLKWHKTLAEKHPKAADAKLGRLARVFA